MGPSLGRANNAFMTPLVSIILPTFERAALLEGVLRDLVSQPLSAIEVLVMDDGSTDDTAARIAAIADPRVAYWNLGRLGVSAAINEGLGRSSAPYVMFLHDHDQISPDLLTALVDVLDRNPTASFAFCGYAFFDSDLRVERERWLFDFPELIPGREFLEDTLMPRINSPVLALSMIRRSALEGGVLDTSIGGCADVELWHRLSATGDVAYVPRILINVRGRDESSQFASPGATLDLMANILRVKHRFLKLLPDRDRARVRKGWRHQVDMGGGYVAWKALEANDRETFRQSGRTIALFGSRWGSWVFRLLDRLPTQFTRALLRTIRSVALLRRRSTL